MDNLDGKELGLVLKNRIFLLEKDFDLDLTRAEKSGLAEMIRILSASYQIVSSSEQRKLRH